MALKRKKIPLLLGDEVCVPLSGGNSKRLILAVVGVEYDARHGGAIKTICDPGDAEIHGDNLLKDFSHNGTKYFFNRLQWANDECVLVFSFK